AQSIGVFTAIHNTPFGDINDVEDDLQPLILTTMLDANRAVSLFANTLRSAEFNLQSLRKRAGENFITVTELADTIVRREGLPFRVAHQIVGKSVRMAVSKNSEITFDILQECSKEVLGRGLSLTELEVEAALSPENFIAVRTVFGGTAPSETRRALQVEREYESSDAAWLVKEHGQIESAAAKLSELVEKYRAG
ncbi:MAG TPA: argininosuccinate lyase, partial [Blastocatellia bacterium]|nr:argininosuccinate lyase [Blastocatellia bacterium]